MKKIKTLLVFFAAAASTWILQSCNDKNNVITPNSGSMTIEIEHVWGTDQVPFLYKQPMVQPMSGDSLTVNLLKYYISNIQLSKTDGSTLSLPNSYYLIDPENNKIEISGIPNGEYTGINFLVGVDSAANCSGIQEGALDPSNGMFWSWSTGYIFVRVEGYSNHSSTGNFLYHLGGYQGPYNAIRAKSFSFGSTNMQISPDANPEVHLMMNVAKLWHGPVKTADLSILHTIGADASMLATNFADGFTFEHLHP